MSSLVLLLYRRQPSPVSLLLFRCGSNNIVKTTCMDASRAAYRAVSPELVVALGTLFSKNLTGDNYS